MANDHDDFDIHLYSPKRTNNQDLNKFNSQKIFNKKTKLVLSKIISIFMANIYACKTSKKENIEIFHGLSNELPLGLKRNGIKSVVTIHDLIF